MLKQFLQTLLYLVHRLPEGGAFFLWEGTDALHEGGQLAVAPEDGCLQLVKLRSSFYGIEGTLGFREDGLELLLHAEWTRGP